VFERFTEGARRAIVLAQEEARSRNHSALGTEHLLLGIAREGGAGARLLAVLGADRDDIRLRVDEIATAADDEPQAHLPFTPELKKALELALRESIDTGAVEVGTPHLVLGLLREGEGVAAKVLTAIGVEFDAARATLAEGIPPPAPPAESSAGGAEPAADVTERTFTKRAQAALVGATEAATLFGHDHVGTEHVLLALIGDQGSAATRALVEMGVDIEVLGARLRELGTARGDAVADRAGDAGTAAADDPADDPGDGPDEGDPKDDADASD
jgi:ATP-dependent Clp protease ATP-binding subunit ClpA